MDYDEVVAAFFHPSPEGIVPPVVAGASPARRLRDAIEPIAMHAVWSRRTNERLAGLGLDFLAGYVWGRAAALGEAAAGVVVSSFAVFEPGMLIATYEQGRTTCSRDDLVAARTESTIESLHDVLGDADVAPIAERLAGRSGASPQQTSPDARCSLGWRVSRGPRTRSGGSGGRASCCASTAATATSRRASRRGSVA